MHCQKTTPGPDALSSSLAQGTRVFSQIGNEISTPSSYAKTRYGKEPKYLYAWMSEEAAGQLADDPWSDLRTLATSGSLGKGVYLSALPEWADSNGCDVEGCGVEGCGDEAWCRVDYDAVRQHIKRTDGKSVVVLKSRSPLYLSQDLGARIECGDDWFWEPDKEEFGI